jgi:hypothetical protein
VLTRVGPPFVTDELVGAGVGVGFHRLDDPGRQGRLVEFDLGRGERQLVRAQLGQFEVGFVERPFEGLPGEEAQVGRVEQPPVAVLEAAGEKGQADAAVGDVGDRDDEAPALFEEGAQAAQRAQRVFQVLDHVGRDDRVEAVITELGLEVEPIQVADDHPLTDFSGTNGHAWVELDPDNVAAAIDEGTRHVAGSRAQLQHPRARLDEVDDVGVDIAGVEVDRLEVVARRVRHRPSGLGGLVAAVAAFLEVAQRLVLGGDPMLKRGDPGL